MCLETNGTTVIWRKVSVTIFCLLYFLKTKTNEQNTIFKGPIIGIEINGTECTSRCQNILQSLKVELGKRFFDSIINFNFNLTD